MGKILDIYFQFAAGGDYYLGQLLTFKDPNSIYLDSPRPHWKDLNAPIVLDALDLTFGRIYEAPVTLMVSYTNFLPPLFIILTGC